MKKHFRVVASLLLTACIMLSACSSGSDSRTEGQPLHEMISQESSVSIESVKPVDPEAEYNSKENAARPYDVVYEGDTYIRVNNNSMFDEIFGRGNYTLEELNDIIDRNKSITKEYKGFFKNYFKELVDFYPGLELRVFAYNLKDVEMEFLSEYEIHEKMGPTTSAMYDYEENKIILKDPLNYETDYWDLICLRHEIAHMRNYFKITKGEYIYIYRFLTISPTEGSVGAMTDEALTVIFSSEPYMEEYNSSGVDNMGYAILVNPMRVILEAIDYSPADSVSHNMYLLEDRMNDVMGDTLDSHEILKAFDKLATGIINSNLELNDPDIVALYDYVARIYIKAHVSENMSYDEIMEQCEGLNKRLLVATPNPQYVRTEVVEAAFSKYCEDHGINK